jgi:hypothetical protein
MITRTGGNYIINGGLFTLDEGQVVSHPFDAVVDSFGSAEEAEAEHRRRHPEQYDEDEA